MVSLWQPKALMPSMKPPWSPNSSCPPFPRVWAPRLWWSSPSHFTAPRTLTWAPSHSMVKFYDGVGHNSLSDLQNFAFLHVLKQKCSGRISNFTISFWYWFVTGHGVCQILTVCHVVVLATPKSVGKQEPNYDVPIKIMILKCFVRGTRNRFIRSTSMFIGRCFFYHFYKNRE